MTRFDLFAEEALYGPDGFYTKRQRAGSVGADFITSPETSALFGSCIAGYLDRVWHELDRPNPYVVIEAGSGIGTLCRDIFLSVQECTEALRYVMVERSELQREIAFAEVTTSCFLDLDEAPLAALRDLPGGSFTGVVLANELLDNLPPRVVQKTTTGWVELHIDNGSEDWQTAPKAAQDMASAIAPNAQTGSCLPLQLKAAVWVNRALGTLDRGRLLIFDYGVENSEIFDGRPLAEWLRTYKNHRRSGLPYEESGTRDITCDVAFDQLPGSPSICSQADWLASQGLYSMTEWARNHWQSSVSSPDAAAVAARSVLDEAATLTDPEGLGGFLVAEWRVGD
ncbi:MAG: SAM-dependent methyltransferase [Actinomycetota bacterium]|nr:SAM-dependent methyltransferase [Actinomycetota bacterium]MEC9473057.1 SAM-dependent methyltransferase [Actinomycetota bacterium]MED5362364.1 SAM-dependent methyltransferase [Actinomycetota bacterium]